MKNNKLLNSITGIIVALFLLSLIYIIYEAFFHPSSTTANIYQDGKLMYSINLSLVEESYEILLESNDGSSNTILVEPDGVTMINASCPDHICMSLGKINSSLIPITCLPNKVVISIEADKNIFSGNTNETLNDAVAY